MIWKNFKLCDLLQNRDDRFKPKDKRIQNLKRIEKIDFSGNLYVSDKISNTDMILVKPGDLVISGINVEKGAMAVYDGEDEITATIHYSSYSYDPGKIDIDFLKLFLKSPEFKLALKEQVPGGIKTEIKPKHLLPLIVYIPESVNDQKKVVKKFSDVNKQQTDLDAQLTHQQNLVKQLRQSFLREAMQGKLTEQKKEDGNVRDLLEKIKAEKVKTNKKEKPLPPIKEEEIPFEIPKNWVWCRLGEICNNITKGSSPKWQGVKYVESPNKGILFITSKNVDSFKVDLSDVTYVEEKFNEIEPRSILRKGDILTNIVGASIGRTAIFELSVPANINQAVCILRIQHSYIDKRFLLFLMNSSYVVQLMFENQFAPGRANLSMGDLANFQIPIPPLAEQKRIVKKLDELMHLCDELQSSTKNSQAQNEMLLQQVLREALAG